MTAAPRIVTFAPETALRVRVPSLIRVALIGLLIGNLGRIPVFSTGARDVPILLNDLLVAGMIVAGVFALVRAHSLKLDRTALFAIAFAAVGGASALLSVQRFGLSGFELAVSLGYLARWLFYFAVYVIAINVLREEDVAPTWRAIEIVLLVFAAFGVFQSIALPGFAQMVYPESRVGADWDPQGHRLVSTWLDPVFAGVFIMMGLLLQLGQIAAGVRVRLWKPLLLAIALMCTASRGALLAAVVGMGVIVLARGLSRRTLRATALATVFLVAATPLVLRWTGMLGKLRVDASAAQRFIMWARGLRVFMDHPVIGIGFNAWGFVQERYGYRRLFVFDYAIDGGLLFVAVMTGVIGLGLYIGMLWSVIGRARALWRRPTLPASHRGMAIGVTAATVGLVVSALFCNALFLPFLMEATWILWALLFVIRVRS